MNIFEKRPLCLILCVGIGGTLILGIGLCLAMQVIASGLFFKILGILIGIIGAAGMLIAYPVYRKTFNKTKEKLAPRILKLAEELSAENLNFNKT